VTDWLNRAIVLTYADWKLAVAAAKRSPILAALGPPNPAHQLSRANGER
jgi:hypothetical protein